MIVLDASAWVDVLTGTTQPPEDTRLAVPPHFDAEVLSVIRGLLLAGFLTQEQADTLLQDHLEMPFTRLSDERDIRRAWTYRHRLSFPDAWYVALAARLEVPWITNDQRAAKTARELGVEAATRPSHPRTDQP